MNSRLAAVIKAFVLRRINFEIDLIPFEFKKLSQKKVSNWLKTESSVWFKPSRPWGFPTVIQIEPTTFCNLNCTVCPVSEDLERLRGNMSFGLFKSIVEQLQEYLFLILFWDWGEPFLNPEAYNMIQYACQAGIKVIASTNGHVFAEGDHARQVVSSGLDVLTVSVDGINQETYQQFRREGRLSQVQEGINNIVAEKNRKNSKTPLINLRYIVMKHNETDLPLLPDFARALGVDVLTLRKLHAVPSENKEWASAKDLVPDQAEYQLPRLSKDKKTAIRIVNNHCKNLWNCPTVHWNGTICRCFMDYCEKHALGDLQKKSFKDIWYGQEFRQVRKKFRGDWRKLELCKDCSSGYAGGNVGSEANAKKLEF